MAEPIELFFSTHSVYAYIGHRRLLEIATAAGRPIVCRPFDLNALIAANGFGLAGALTPVRQAYFFGREIERWAEYRNVPLYHRIPDNHHHDLGLSSTFLIAAINMGHDGITVAGEILRAHWIDGADLADPATMIGIAQRLDLDADTLFQVGRSAEVRSIYEANTREALARPIFGSPTYFVDGDMFYGQDRLELVARACERPFEHRWQTKTDPDRPICGV
jgi:2-hydroxychromene-2-carboxylate isomerase